MRGSIARPAAAIVLFLQIAGVLGVVAYLSPVPTGPSDKGTYEQISRDLFVPGGDIHSFRVLVPWTLRLFPGEGRAKWRTYAVVCEAAAACMMAIWVLRFGVSERTARQIAWLTAVGAGTLYTLFDPYTADPLMHLAGPAMMMLALSGPPLVTTFFAVIGVFGKEFALVPVVVSAVTRLQQRRLVDAAKLFASVALAFAIWVGWQLLLRALYGYDTSNSPSAYLMSGSYLAVWLTQLQPRVIVISLLGALGALWVLWPVGIWIGKGELRQMSWAALLPLAAFNYVQQPDRALWAFAFMIMPAAALVLDRVRPALGWCLVAAQLVVGLRLGAQLEGIPPLRLTLIVTIALGAVIAWQALKRSPEPAGRYSMSA